MFKYTCEQTILDDKPFDFGDIFNRLCADDQCIKIIRLNDATFDLFTLNVNRVISELKILGPIFKNAKRNVYYIINNVPYQLVSFDSNGIVFSSVKIFEYMTQETISYNYLYLSRNIIPIVESGVYLLLDDSVFRNGEIIDDVESLEPLLKPLSLMNESLMYKLNM
jgi:hypothetical protein